MAISFPLPHPASPFLTLPFPASPCLTLCLTLPTPASPLPHPCLNPASPCVPYRPRRFVFLHLAGSSRESSLISTLLLRAVSEMKAFFGLQVPKPS